MNVFHYSFRCVTSSLHERSWPVTVPDSLHELSMSIFAVGDFFINRIALKPSWYVQKQSGTLEDQERWTFKNDQERSNRWAVLNVHSGQKYKDLKILWNQVHGTFKFTIQKRKIHCIFKRRFQQEPPKLESGGSIYRLEIIFSEFIIQKLEFYSSENNCFDRWFSEKRHFQRLLRPVFR